MNKNVTLSDIATVAKLRELGHSYKDIEEILKITHNRVKYLISFLPKKPRENADQPRKWYTKERKKFTDTMPNPYPKWWCALHNFDRNYYRPNWKR